MVPAMLRAADVVADAQALLADGLSARAIAAILPLSPSSVNKIARELAVGAAGTGRSRPKLQHAGQVRGPVVRCGTCRALVKMPCRACGLRHGRKVYGFSDRTAEMQLELDGEDLARLREVQQARKAEGWVMDEEE